jgi:hypothetical protein
MDYYFSILQETQVLLLRLGVSTVETNRDRDRERPSC